MQIESYNFFFHPMEIQERTKRIQSIVTIVALSILSGGLYAAVLGCVHLSEVIGKFVQGSLLSLIIAGAALSILGGR